ncbi:ATP-dependent nuclease [Methylobacterium mesophilicum]|uniref:ATP-dependent nuclease n=1 Tax=Methylobacterium mesophilicum TaxID=39956 RepID=UPI001EE2D04F|nr:AAA family ATPase [Methylobacterium mesophilicum]
MDYEAELEISKIFRQYFQKDLIIHKSPGRVIPLYVGERPPFEGKEMSSSRSYLDKIEDLDPLQEQGDGFRSFSSILLRVWTGNQSIILVDEPEAFLHPPQARAVGELISAGNGIQRQVFISTHSNDVIQGLLSKFPDRVSVVRLSRSGSECSATYLPNERVSELWNDPILRYSNILNALFHRQVIITEADGDCRFYEAIADAQLGSNQSTFYTYAGGKDRIAVIVSALRAVQVPVKVIVDFDVFAGDKAFKGIVEAYGIDWETCRAPINSIRSAVQSKKPWLVGRGFKERVRQVLNEIPDNEIVDKSKITTINLAMREASPWEAIKDAGMAVVPQGEVTSQLVSLVDRLSRVGFYIVPVGQMERFCKSIGDKGPRWVTEVLKRDLVTDPELQEARQFVAKVVASGIGADGFTMDRSFARRLKLSVKDISVNRAYLALKFCVQLLKIVFYSLFIFVLAGQILEWIYRYYNRG